MATAFTLTPGDIRLDNMRVTIGGTAMGGTVGGVEISVTHETLEQTVDQYGKTPVQTFNQGDRVTVKFGLAESTYANLAKSLGTGTLRSSGGTAVGVGGKFSGAFVGSSVAVALIFHPLDKDDSAVTNDINVWKAVCLRCDPIKYGPDQMTMFATEWLAIVDTSKTAGKQLIDFGLAAAT